MPEGHTIHRAARDQAGYLLGEIRASSPQGRFADGAADLDGQRLDGIDAYGKHLIYRWEEGHLLHVHLGLFGKFRRHRDPAPVPRDSVRLRLIADDATLDLTGPTACELFDGEDLARLLARIGPDPLRPDSDPTPFFARASRSRVAIGSLIMDQSVISGVGNVYRAEALFVCGIDPAREARSLSDNERTQLWDTVTTMLQAGVRANRIITVDPKEAGVSRSKMRRRERTYAYRRESCLRCQSAIQKGTLGARTVYWCPTCQT